MTSLLVQVCAASETQRPWERTLNALPMALLLLSGMFSLKEKRNEHFLITYWVPSIHKHLTHSIFIWLNPHNDYNRQNNSQFTEEETEVVHSGNTEAMKPGSEQCPPRGPSYFMSLQDVGNERRRVLFLQSLFCSYLSSTSSLNCLTGKIWGYSKSIQIFSLKQQITSICQFVTYI